MNRYETTNSSLFLNKQENNIPDWISNTAFTYVQNTNPELNDVTQDFVKEAAFNSQPGITRVDADNNIRSTNVNQSTNQLILQAKIELSRFLVGKYYQANAKEVRDKYGTGVKLEVSISNVPAKFLFKYSSNGSHLYANKTFEVLNTDSEFAEYPWSKAGLEEAIDDIKHGRIKTADKAPAYKAYTITLAEITKRYNGDIRKTMDRVKELLASQEIIGVGTNEFASVYTMDSLFPGLKKEGTIDNAPTFEFVKNIEHVAVKPYSSSDKLVASAALKIKSMTNDFKILSSFRQDDNLIINTVIMQDGLTKSASFNFDIVNDKVDELNFIETDGNKVTSLYETYQQRNDNNSNRLNDKIILSLSDIYNKLLLVIDHKKVDSLIDYWESNNFIKRINTNQFVSQYTFNDLLNKIDTEVLSQDEVERILKLSARVEDNFNRITQQDTGIRNDDKLIHSSSIRLAVLYNYLSKYLDTFKLDSMNDDATVVNIINISERGKEKLKVTAEYDGNKLINVNIDGNKNISEALKTYKQFSKNNIFAQAIFSESQLNNVLNYIFKDKVPMQKIIDLFELVDLGNNFYASSMPLSAIINTLEQAKVVTNMSVEEKAQYWQDRAREQSFILADYLKDTGIRNDYEYISSKMLRLSSLYNYLSKRFTDFKIINVSDNAENVNIDINTDHGIENINIKAQYNHNHLKKVLLPKIMKSIVNIYKAPKKIITKVLFTKDMLHKILINIFKDVDNVIDSIINDFTNKIDEQYYASIYSLSTIIQELAKRGFTLLTDNERNELLELSARNNQKIIAEYLKDTGSRTGKELIFSASIRLANLYNAFSNNNQKFVIASFNKDITNVELTVNTMIGNIKHCYEIEYDVNKPITITRVSSFIPKQKQIIEKYSNIHGKQDTANKAVFSKAMVKTALKNIVADNNLDNAVNQILNKSVSLGNNLYGADCSLVRLINDSDIQYNIPDALEKQAAVNRYDLQDTGFRDIEYNDSLISSINATTAYLDKFFNNFKMLDAQLEDNILNYQAKLFDDNTGLSNKIDFKVQIENGHVKDCKVKINDQLIPIKDVYQAFSTNSILNKYLQMNPNNKVNSSIVFSLNQLTNKLKNLLNSTSDINNTLTEWERSGKIQRIASNIFASNYNLETLLSISNLVPLTDEELKIRLNKSKNLYKLSKAYIKDNDTRTLNNEWDINRFIQFARSELNKKYPNVLILDADINDKLFKLKVKIPVNGVMNICNVGWTLRDNKPFKFIINIPKTSKESEQYTHRFTIPIPYHNKVIINIRSLLQSLLGIVDKQSAMNAINKFVNDKVVNKIDSNYLASNYSIAELIELMKKQGFINNEQSKQELDESSRQIANHSLTPVDATMRPALVAENKYLHETINKLINNINIAENNKLITARKKEEWINKLKDVHNINVVVSEFKQYLRKR